MTRPFSAAFKQKMVQRLIGKDAVSAMQLARETGVRQKNLSRWLQEARSLPLVRSRDVTKQAFTLEENVLGVAYLYSTHDTLTGLGGMFLPAFIYLALSLAAVVALKRLD